MDYSPMVAQLWEALTWLVLATLVVGLRRSPWAKGQSVERLVRLFASGRIFGANKQAHWPRKHCNQTFMFQNQLRQNCKHLKALKASLGVELEQFPVLTFVGGSALITEVPSNVTQGIGFVCYIEPLQQPASSAAEVGAMLHTLQTGRRAPTLATQHEHVQNFKRRSEAAAERQSPKRGNARLIRSVESGPIAGKKFCGCPGFSNCRTMQNI